jgi:RNA polymerase sigma-70 factor (ECF subfamily)
MDDSGIVELYWRRDEQALSETESKYGRYCLKIADNILHSGEDARECVNDTWLGAWNAIPPHRPAILSTFLGKITRRLSLKRLRDSSADKRGGGSVPVSFSELEECVPSGQTIDQRVEANELTEIINSFLGTLTVTQRRVFLRRYWYCDAVTDIAARFGFSEGKTKMMLKRTRDKLRERLEKEGIFV